MTQRHALITGGAGFIGSHLADLLLKSGFEVTILDCLIPQVHEGTKRDSDGWPTYLNKESRRIKGNILSEHDFDRALEKATHLVHLAASVGVAQSMSNIVDYTKNNTMSAAFILERLSKGNHSIQRIAVASSMSIYGEGLYRSPGKGEILAPLSRDISQLEKKQWDLIYEGEVLEPIPTTEKKPLYPASIYAINKRDQEEMFLVMGKALKIPTIALRLFNAYGSRQALSNPYTGVAAIFISQLLKGLPPQIFEDGKQLRDFVHVSDVASAFLTILKSEMQIWDVFNVGSGHSISIYDIAKTLAHLLNREIEPEILNSYRMGDIRNCFADIKKIEKTFNYKPQTHFKDGMKELINWVCSQEHFNI